MPVQLRVVENGMPVIGARVSFYAPWTLRYGGIGSLDPAICQSGGDLISVLCTAITGSDGVATFSSITSPFAGTYDLQMDARSADRTRDLGSVVLNFTFAPKAPPYRLTLLSGAEQYVVMGTNAQLPLRFKVETADGRPVVGAKVEYERGSEGVDWLGFHYPSTTLTDAAGVATSPTIHGGWAVGTFPLTAQLFDPDAGQFVTITVGINIVNEQGVPDVDLTNMWWSGPSENGWGMSVVKHRDQLFNVLFVYDRAGLPTWYVVPGGQWSSGAVGGSFGGDFYSPVSSPWFAYDASKLVAGAPIGRMFLDFKGPRRAGLGGYILFERDGGLGQGIEYRQMMPQDFRGSEASPITGLADMWWGGPSQNGWGIAILEQFGNLFSVWYTYGADGKPTWYVMPGGSWNNMTAYSGNIFKTVGTDWVFGVYDASKLQSQQVGRYTLRFLEDGRAAFDYVLEGRAGTLPLERQPF